MKRNRCECGCGGLARSGNRFIYGHSRRGKKHSLETREKLSRVKMGHPVSEETKEKISWALMGNPVSEETRKKISKANKGKIVSEETKEKMKGHHASEETRKKISKANVGHIVSEETREKISKALRNENSDLGKHWDEYHPYMAQYQYRQLQKEVKERDRSRCVLCNKKKRIATHHIVPVRIGYKSRLCDHESNLLMLCRSCHKKVEPFTCKDKWKEFLPIAKRYLSQFGYKEMLLDGYALENKDG